MGFFDKAIIGGFAALIGNGIVQTYRSNQVTNRRKSTPIQFDDTVTQRDFNDAADRIGRKTPRVARVLASGMTVHLTMRSNSGLTTWKAEIDFNDYGRLTGNYWISSENTQSPIPEFFAQGLQEEIRKAGS
ncbi:hypothetical protein [Arthrobacter sp. 260]|uniref:hypothetical protein n=1 Tax=Arthrobacter sp. 260 TaxID=2735314 RepID=UPI001491F7D2|nr:hypothetical protein [Arthrobacter sp. 260]NOJ58425.1 hypothetical protein [Arthrobacter sp. 260]